MKVDELRFSNHLILRMKERNLKPHWITDVVQHRYNTVMRKLI